MPVFPSKSLSFKSLSIQKKLVLIILGISSVMLLSSMGIFMSSELNSLKKKMREDLSTLADLVGKNSSAAIMFYDARTAKDNLQTLKAKPHIISAHLLNENQDIVASYHRNKQSGEKDFLKAQMLSLLSKQQEAYLCNTNNIHIIKRIMFDRDNSLLGYIHIESDRNVYWQRVKEFIYTIILMLSISLWITLIIAYRAQKIFTDPIVNLLLSMQHVSREQDYRYRIESPCNDEVGELINGFNEMLEKLEQQEQLTRNYQKELEKRVDERTRQLQTARDKALAASRTKSIFLANMSHEIRTPMNAILGYSQLLQQSDLKKDQSRQLSIINKSGNHLLSLIDDILELSKIEAGSLEIIRSDFDLLELVQNVENMFKIRCNQKHLQWKMECFTAKPILVSGDQGKLRQVLINLISNAIKFTEQGEILFRIENTEKDHYKFTVKDTGPGIENNALEHIFDAFHQGKQGEIKGGTGLGLSISRQYINLFGGQLKVQTSLNQGARFYFDIVLAPSSEYFIPEESLIVKTKYFLKSSQLLTALVVDDVKDNIELLKNVLCGIGFQVKTATNGKEALQQIEKSRPDIVFMDIRMPVMDGIEAIKRLRQIYSSSELKCVAVSASTLQHQSGHFTQLGYDLFISKPFHFDSIFFAIKELMGDVLEETIQATGDDSADNEVFEINTDHRQTARLDLGKNFFDELLEAAEYGQLTRLNALIKQLEKYGEDGKIASRKIKLLINTADLDGIINYVKSMIDG